MEFSDVKKALEWRGCDASLFDEKTFKIVLRDRKKALELLDTGDDALEYIKNSEMAQTRFYKESGDAWCYLIGVLHAIDRMILDEWETTFYNQYLMKEV